jgi:hypothetical protein
MKKILVAIALALSLGACTASQQATWTRLTSAQVSPQAVYLAENAFDAVEVTATGYLQICHARMSTPGCSSTAIAQIIPAVRSGRIARTNLNAFMKAHPDALGATGLYDALTAATNTLQAVATQYNIAGVTK